MSLDQETLKKLCGVAVDAAKAAGDLIASYDVSKLQIEHKQTGDTLRSQVVTEVDRLSEDLILKRLEDSRATYDIGLLTEEREDDGSRFEKDYFWCLDPLDGTLCFTEDRSGYAVSIALVTKSGESVIGVVYNPREKELFYAYNGGGAYMNDKPFELASAFDADAVQKIEGDGAVMNACRTLQNSPAYFMKQPKEAQGGGCLWDYAATACLYSELGAWVSDAAGNPLNLNSSTSLFMNHCGVLFATHADIAKAHI